MCYVCYIRYSSTYRNGKESLKQSICSTTDYSSSSSIALDGNEATTTLRSNRSGLTCVREDNRGVRAQVTCVHALVCARRRSQLRLVPGNFSSRHTNMLSEIFLYRVSLPEEAVSATTANAILVMVNILSPQASAVPVCTGFLLSPRVFRACPSTLSRSPHIIAPWMILCPIPRIPHTPHNT